MPSEEEEEEEKKKKKKRKKKRRRRKGRKTKKEKKTKWMKMKEEKETFVFVCYLNAVQCCNYQHVISVFPLSFGCVLIYLGGTELFKF